MSEQVNYGWLKDYDDNKFIPITQSDLVYDTSGNTVEDRLSSITNAIDNLNSDVIKEVVAGDGLTGGGSAGSVTLNVGAGEGISVEADKVINAGVRLISEGTKDGTISVDTNGTTIDVPVHGLGFQDDGSYHFIDNSDNVIASVDNGGVHSTDFIIDNRDISLTGVKNTVDNVKKQLDETKYAASPSVGGPATSANKLNTNAGSSTNPVYFENGIPKATGTSLDKDISGNAASADKVNNKLTIVGKIYDGSTDVTVDIADLGVTGAMVYRGTSSTAVTDGGTEAPTIGGSAIATTNLQKGNVVLYGQQEFVWNGSKWELLGDEGSYALKSVTISAGSGLTGGGSLAESRTISHADTSSLSGAQEAASGKAITSITVDDFGHVTATGTAAFKTPQDAVSSPTASGNSTSFIDTISQDTNGKITATKRTIPNAGADTLGLVKSGGDVTISSGVITVNDDSHNHVISNIDNLQTNLNNLSTAANNRIHSILPGTKNGTIKYAKYTGSNDAEVWTDNVFVQGLGDSEDGNFYFIDNAGNSNTYVTDDGMHSTDFTAEKVVNGVRETYCTLKGVHDRLTTVEGDYISGITAGDGLTGGAESGGATLNVNPGTGIQISNDKVTLKTASASERGGIQLGYAQSGKNYPVQLSSEKAYVNVPWTDTDTKVTSADNHYTPSANTASALNVDASSTTAATWGSTDLVTGVNIQRDAKGHVTGLTVDSIQMPANPDTGATSVEVTGSGSAVSSASYDASSRKLTLTKGYTYTLPLAASGTRGGIQLGFTQSGKNYPVQLSGEKAYVNVPWTDTNTDTGATSVEVTGSGNAVTAASYDPTTRKLTLTKGATYNNTTDTDTGATSVEVTGTGNAVTTASYDEKTRKLTLTKGATYNNFTYTLPLAASGTRGGIQLGYSQSGQNYPVQLSGEKAYVNVPWTDTTNILKYNNNSNYYVQHINDTYVKLRFNFEETDSEGNATSLDKMTLYSGADDFNTSFARITLGSEVGTSNNFMSVIQKAVLHQNGVKNGNYQSEGDQVLWIGNADKSCGIEINLTKGTVYAIGGSASARTYKSIV